MKDKEKILSLYHRMYKAMVEKDMDALGELLDDSMVLIHMTGRRQDKKSYMESIADGTLNYYSEKTDNVDIKVSGDVSVLTGDSRVEAAVYGGGRSWWRLRLTMRMIKKDGIWKFTEGRASTY